VCSFSKRFVRVQKKPSVDFQTCGSKHPRLRTCSTSQSMGQISSPALNGHRQRESLDKYHYFDNKSMTQLDSAACGRVSIVAILASWNQSSSHVFVDPGIWRSATGDLMNGNCHHSPFPLCLAHSIGSMAAVASRSGLIMLEPTQFHA
jgi:hypothetical protein